MRPLRVIFAFASLAFVCGPTLFAQSLTDARAQYDQLAADTTLSRDGIHPWHMHATFDLYDLSGKKTESGTIEEWWVSKQQYRVAIESPSVHEIYPHGPGAEPGKAMRAVILSNHLYDEIVHPLPAFDHSDLRKFEAAPEKSAGTKLDCIRDEVPFGNHMADQGIFCRQPGGNALRVVYKNGSEAVRNHTGRFLDTEVAMEISIAYEGKTAVTGIVDKLEGFDPAKSDVQLLAPSPKLPPGLAPKIPKVIHSTAPQYLNKRISQNIHGKVQVCIRIDKTGSVVAEEVLATPDLLLEGAALNSLKEWKFTPYMVDGKPVDYVMVMSLLI